MFKKIGPFSENSSPLLLSQAGYGPGEEFFESGQNLWNYVQYFQTMTNLFF